MANTRHQFLFSSRAPPGAKAITGALINAHQIAYVRKNSDNKYRRVTRASILLSLLNWRGVSGHARTLVRNGARMKGSGECELLKSDPAIMPLGDGDEVAKICIVSSLKNGWAAGIAP